MKKILIALFALTASVAFGATTLPVQLLNPTGSTGGQAIISTGASSAPAWGNVSGAALAAQAANTVLANVTASSASPTAVAMPSCSTSSSALDYTAGAGWGCNTAINAATLGSATFASPPSTGYGSATPEPVAATTISATGLITPTSTIGIKGTATNDNAQAGSVGEFPVPTNVVGGAISSGTPLMVSSVTLQPGDYEIQACADFVGGTGATGTYFETGVSLSSTAFGAFPQNTTIVGVSVVAAAGDPAFCSPELRETFTTATAVYALAESFFSGGTMASSGNLHIRRAR